MPTTSAPVVTYDLPNLGGPSLAASVVGANPTATTLWANCMGSTNDYNCIFNASITFGPWAMATPPPDASTGVYDLFINNPPFTGSNEPATISTALGENDKETWTYSVHCEMTSYTIPDVCTTINIGGANGGHPTATISGYSNIMATLGSMAPQGIAITAGYAKLATATNPGSSASSTAAAGSGSGSTAKNSTMSVTHGASGASSAAVAHQTTNSAGANIINLRTLGLVALVGAFFVQ